MPTEILAGGVSCGDGNDVGIVRGTGRGTAFRAASSALSTLVEVGRGSGPGCRPLLVYVTVELLIRCAALPTEIRCPLIKVRMIMLV
ncbi:hypothetical protein [Streptomyces sp. NBC_00343]|uniref:hypothetical protein n=1 Tax=Streptomyces sp. NBC_00343 TaxID=2975719 RepID=UPI002E28B08F|nr:hypothetical protein [Streptomyces sp. NBC_00343]